MTPDFPFLAAAAAHPRAHDQARIAVGRERWSEQLARLQDSQTKALVEAAADDPAGAALLDALFAASPFLTDCLLSDMGFFTKILKQGPDKVFAAELAALKPLTAPDRDRAAIGAELRRCRRRVALLVALADIAGHWPLEKVCESLSDFAEAALSVALGHLLTAAAARGHLNLANPAQPEEDCGYVVLGMGKLGARELNYSSDIDLIVLFDPDKIDYRGPRSPQEAMVRLTRDLVNLLEERTADGYVARVDLRLRPDPGATPLAISYNAAMAYYESMGQNWERAAMIKARPVAGDLPLGEAFLDELRPFVWRKHLDFWAIQDVHSIKRQINAHRGGGKIALAGHNVKLGRGGIREIEFFAQTQQLIYGGREPTLRAQRTLDALQALVDAERIDAQVSQHLAGSYRYLRCLEHRLQMMDDHQTHSLPEEPQSLDRVAAFMGYADVEGLRDELFGHMGQVEQAYSALFEQSQSLSEPGNLVFTGGEPEVGTLKTLANLGFRDGALVFNLVRTWHHGRYRATRSTRAREILTELMPTLLAALGRTSNPDGALIKFDEFLAGLPAGVQLFSLLQANPKLLDLLAQIMGSAPALAEHLSRKPGLLDAVLSQDFFAPVPAAAVLTAELEQRLAQARAFEEVLDLSRLWANDRKFQVGTQILRHTLDIDDAGRALSDIADAVLATLFPPVRGALAQQHGEVAGAGLAVLAFGKLGGREMTVASDLDLVFLYEAEADVSDGPKPLAASQYFGRLAQRFINALSAPTAEGRLYEIDMRLRPSGNAGPIATSLNGMRQYHQQDAWTWELMALTRARVIHGEPAFCRRIEATLQELLRRPQDPQKLVDDVVDMRARIARERSAKTVWQVKHLRGGLVDLEFLAQYLQLRHAAAHPQVLDCSTQGAFTRLAEAGLIGRSLGQRLIEATRLMRQVQGFLRLTVGEGFDEEAAPDGLKTALAEATGLESFDALKAQLTTTAQIVHEAFREMVELQRSPTSN